MTDWNYISSEKDITDIMMACGDFHDCCIVSASYQSGAFVDGDSSMHFGKADDRIMTVTLHSQCTPKTIELCFSGLRLCRLTGRQENCTCEILGAFLSFFDAHDSKLIVWSDNSDFDISDANNSDDTYIVAEKLKWRRF